MVRSEAPKANRLPPVFSRFMLVTKGQGSSNKPQPFRATRRQSNECLYPRLSPSITTVSTEELHPIDIDDAQQDAELSATTAGA